MTIVNVIRCNFCESDINKNNKASITIFSQGSFKIFFKLDNRESVSEDSDRLDFCDKECMVKYFDNLMEKFEAMYMPRRK